MRIPFAAILSVIALSCSGCIVQGQESGSTQITSYESCTYSDKQVYSLSSNPSADFTSSYVSYSDTVMDTTCSNLYVGEIAYGTMDSISRSGSTVTFSNHGATDSMSVSGTALSHPALVGCSKGVSIHADLLSGSLDSSAYQLILQWKWKLTKDNCLSANSDPAASPGVTNTVSSLTEPAGNNSHNLIYFNSQRGDWVGSGLVQTFTVGAGDTFTAQKNYDNGVSISYHDASFTHWWTMDFASGDNTPLVAGTTYANAQRFAFKAPGAPGIDISGDGRGCNTISGTFTVLNVSYGAGTAINSFWVEFEQHCEGGVPALYGTIRFNAGPPLP